jgi:hypothetical protein
VRISTPIALGSYSAGFLTIMTWLVIPQYGEQFMVIRFWLKALFGSSFI